MADTPIYKGWAAHDTNAADGGLKFESFEPKPWDEDDIEVKIMYCGVCGTDASFCSGEFGPIERPTVCGHEGVGCVTRAGSKAGTIKVGDMVGVGFQSDSCGKCDFWQEQGCPDIVWTFGQAYKRGKGAGYFSHGAFANYWRGPSHFAIPIPSNLDPALAAPLLCGGLTVYSPMKQYGISAGKHVGVIGLGGLGHMAVLIAKGMGAKVTVISRGTSKKELAKQLGADSYIATGSNLSKDLEAHKRSLDFVVATSNSPEFPLMEYLSLLKHRGLLCMVGIPSKPMTLIGVPLITNAIGVVGSFIGSPATAKNLLQLAAEQNIKPWIEKVDFRDINTALPNLKAGKPKFRYVLVNTENGGKM